MVIDITYLIFTILFISLTVPLLIITMALSFKNRHKVLGIINLFTLPVLLMVLYGASTPDIVTTLNMGFEYMLIISILGLFSTLTVFITLFV